MMVNKPICPNCQIAMIPIKSKYPGSKFFWGCRNYPNCYYKVSAYPNGNPVGTPADRETAQARIKAHEAFDKIWKEWGYPRNEAYTLLQTIMGLPPEDAHIGKFSKEQCDTLIEKLKTYKLDK